MLKIKLSRDRLIYNMGIPVPGKDSLYTETVPWFHNIHIFLSAQEMKLWECGLFY